MAFALRGLPYQRLSYGSISANQILLAVKCQCIKIYKAQSMTLEGRIHFAAKYQAKPAQARRSMLPFMQAGAFDTSKKVDVLCAEERSSAYLDHDVDKNIFGSFYHVREPKTRRLPLTVPDFAVCLKTWTSKKLLLKV